MSSDTTMHPSDETLAALAAGTIDPASRMATLEHTERCDDCMAALLAANSFLQEESPAVSRRPWWLALTAAVLLAAIAVPLILRSRQNRDGVAQLVAAAPRDERVLEARVSGGFTWAPWNGPRRAAGADDDTSRLKLAGAAGELIDRAKHDDSADAQHAAATALLLIEHSEDAIRRLEAVAAKTPKDARAWNDLAAARYSAALQLQRPSLLPEALAAADRASNIDAANPEAAFNRALVLERMGLTREARSAWQRYLAIDPSSPWSKEARQHLARLDASTTLLRFKKELPSIERAAAAHEAATVQRIVAHFPQQSRAWCEAEELGLWGEAVHRGDEAEATRRLGTARAVGEALTKISSESLLLDAVRTIERAAGAARADLADAHRIYRAGRLAYSKQQLAEGERSLRESAARFAAARSPMAIAARYYAASARYDQHDTAAACAEQSQLVDALASRPRFAAMGAQVQWALALCRMNEADWSAAVPLLARAESGFRTLGEQTNRGFILMLTASTYTYLGDRDEAWAARVRAFDALSAGGNAEQLAVSLGAAARSEVREGRYDAARAMLQLEENADRALAFDALLVDALVRRAVLNAATGDDNAARAAAREAAAAAGHVADPALHSRAAADADFAAGAAALRRDPSRARRSLTTAIDAYRARELPVMLPEAYLLRARASLALHDGAAAMRDLADGIAAVEKHPVAVANDVSGTGVLDAGSALFEEAIRLELDRGGARTAFAYAERARPQIATDAAVDAAAIQQRLAGTGAAVVELATLADEVVAWTITANELVVTRIPIARERLEHLVAAGDLDALSALLISRLPLDGVRQLIVVPDPSLAAVPFHALTVGRTRQPLIERMPVSIALSASSLRREPARRAGSLLVVGLPTEHAAALPELDAEVGDVRSLYARTAVLTPPTFAALTAAAAQADVIHIGGHTAREPGAGHPALLFGDGRVGWQRLAAARRFDDATVVLAACDTLREPSDRRVRALSLGGGFVAGGAAAVIGTLTPITDRSARTLFGAIHRRLAAGADAAEAVRAVQASAAANGDGAWKSIAVLTRVIPTNDIREATHGDAHGLLHGHLYASARLH